jgi:DnaJ family protein C protein 19
MATPVIVGVGAITAALVGRHLVRNGIIGKRAADQWVKGGFKAKMDRKEAIAILGLKFAPLARSITLCLMATPFAETA